ncbi:hypothetical protein H6B10_17760, partial [Gemmiger formicilis]|uniref:hypothetical protein n=1 Tax=Gemmiger formicilis TaxID=745368 RepID=UPI00195E52D8
NDQFFPCLGGDTQRLPGIQAGKAQMSVLLRGDTGMDLYGIDDAGEREARVTAYVEELESYTAGLEAQHGTLH